MWSYAINDLSVLGQDLHCTFSSLEYYSISNLFYLLVTFLKNVNPRAPRNVVFLQNPLNLCYLKERRKESPFKWPTNVFPLNVGTKRDRQCCLWLPLRSSIAIHSGQRTRKNGAGFDLKVFSWGRGYVNCQWKNTIVLPSYDLYEPHPWSSAQRDITNCAVVTVVSWW